MAKSKAKDKRKEEFKQFAARGPELTVLTDHALKPEETYRDSFNMRYRLGPVYDILRYPGTRTPMSIAVYGDWGAGKTTAMRWLHGLIDEWNTKGKAKKKITIKPVWFYPWKYDKKEDVWRGLVSEVIIKSIDVKGATIQTVKNAAKQFGLFLGRSFLHVLAGVKLKAKTPGDTAKAEIDLASIKEILAEYQDAAHPEKAYLNEFESSLENWIKNTLGDDERMVIFIDDLDRCMPDIALQVLEAIKLYLNIDKLIFVVGVDRKVVDKLVKEHYKKLGLDEKKSGNYLAKMFQVEVQVEPSEQQISYFLDEQLKDIPYWREPHLSEDEREIFRNLIFRLAKRNPREVKRLINSALMMGAGAVMIKTPQSGQNGIKFNQGLQLFFVRKILDERYTMGLLVGSDRGNKFFSQWSKIVCEGKKKDKDFPCSIKIPEDVGTKIPEEGRGIEGSLDREVKRVGKEVQKVAGAIELKILAGKYGEAYRPMVENPRFSGLFNLLEDEDLGELMRIEYPSEAEVDEIAAVVGTSKDADIIREAIVRQLGKKPDELKDEDYSKIKALNLSGLEISDLEAIKGLSSLERLYLNETQISDLEPIKGLSSLQGLGLNRTRISDLGPIKGLSILQGLGLNETKVSDLEPLWNLRELRRLYLNDTQVSDIGILKGLTNLQELLLNGTQVSDLEPLRNLTDLRRLGVNSTRVSDIEPIKNLINLIALDLNETNVSDFESLRNLSELQRLYLSGTGVSDIGVLSGLTNLQRLELNNTQVSSLEAIKGLSNLKELYLKDTKVSDEQLVELEKALPELKIYR